MSRIISWIKTHKLTSFLLLVVGYFLLKNSFYGIVPIIPSRSTLSPGFDMAPSSVNSIGVPSMMKLGSGSVSENYLPPVPQNIPPSASKNRLVVRESNLSLQVKNVRETNDKIIDYTNSIGGFMISSNISNPLEAASGSLTIRLPGAKMREALTYIRGLSVQVVSEYLSGEDVTDQYTDINARLDTLNKTKAKFEEIMNKAVLIQDILDVQNQLINIQSQIDSLKGEQQYLLKTSELAKITIYLSTDEFALPYAPNNAWRPEVIFKTAVRSLVGTLRGIGELIIWLGVYSVLWLPIGLIIYLLYRRSQKRKIIPPPNL